MALRFNPPPGWSLPAGFTPGPGWQPDPSWPPVPPGWQLWVDDGQPSGAFYDQGPYGTGQYDPGPYGTGQPPAMPPGRSGWAISSFILGLLGVWPLGLTFGIIAARRIRRLGQKGVGLTIAGIALSVVWLVLGVIIFGLAAGSTATRSASGKITVKGHLGVFALASGDCFNNPADTKRLVSVTAIPCTQPHNAQVYAKFRLSGSNFSYPGSAKVTRLAENGCNSRLGNIDKSKVNNGLTVHFLFPEEGSWLDGQRAVSCLVVSQTTDLTSSVLKS